MYFVERFRDLTYHQSLTNRACEILSKDSRVKAIYLSGSLDADEYSDVDLTILCDEEDLQNLLDERYKIAEEVGEILCAAIPPVSDRMLVVFYKEEVKVDFSYGKLPLQTRPDRAYIDALFDPEGHLGEVIENSKNLEWETDIEFLRNRIKHHFLGLSYTVSKFGRGEFWDGEDCINWYRKNIIMFEDILAKRRREGTRRIEKKFDDEKLKLFELTLVKETSRKELFRAMDVINLYFETFLKSKFQELEVFPEKEAKEMLEYYERKKREYLERI
jgi:predicted nucleotidyltransferase